MKFVRRGLVAAALAVVLGVGAWLLRALVDEPLESRAASSPRARLLAAASGPSRDELHAATSAPETTAAPTSAVFASVASAAPAELEGPSARFLRLQADVDRAIARQDGYLCRRLMYDVAELGREGWPLLERIARASFDRPDDPDGRETSRVRGELGDVFESGRAKELVADALAHPDQYSDELRRLVAGGGGDTLSESERKKVLARLAVEKDEAVVAAYCDRLRHRADFTVAELSHLVGAQQNAGPRRVLVETLARKNDDDARAVLATVARDDRDLAVRGVARAALLRHAPPVAGFLIEKIDAPPGAPPVLEPGDIVTKVDGAVLRWSWSSSEREGRHTVEVWRDGATLQLVTSEASNMNIDGEHIEPAKPVAPRAYTGPEMPSLPGDASEGE